MNKVFKIVWSQALKTWVVASELTKSKSKSKSTVDAKTAWAVVSALATLSGTVYAASGIDGGATSGGSNGTAISACKGGSQAQAIGSNAIAIGCDSEANNNDGKSGDTNIQLVNRKNPGNPYTGTEYLMQNAASTAIGYRAKAANASIALGDKAQATDVGIAIGLGAESLANSAIALGSMAQAKGNTAFALGRQSVAAGHYATAIGNVAYAKSDSSIAMGHSATADGYRAIAIGGADSKKAPSDGVSDGAGYQASTQTLAKGEQAIAVGSGASATQNNALALGSGAVASLVGGVAIGQDSQTTASNKQAYLTGAAAPKAVVSIGAKGSERRMQHVSAGAEDTDAVNVSQLKAVHTLAEKGWKVSAQGANTSTVAPGDVVDFSNTDGNLKVAKGAANQKLTIDLNKDIKLDSLTINNGGPVLNKTGINLNNQKITNVKEGTNEGDAVNVFQLDKSIKNLNIELTGKGLNFLTNDGTLIHRDLGTTLVVKGDAITDGTYSGNNIKTIAGKEGALAVQIADSPKFGEIVINDEGRISGLKAGVAGTDAVNVDQLKEAAGKGWNVTAQGKDISVVAPESTVDFGNADGNIVVSKEGNNLKFDLAKDLTGDSLTINNGGPVINRTGINLNNTKIVNLTEGTNDGDAVNVKQLTKQITNVTNNLTAKGLNFSGNEGGAIHRDLGTTLAIKGAATTAGEYSGHNLKTVANADGSMALQMAESPKFGNVTINDAGRITGLEKGVEDTDAVNVSQLKDASGKGWNVTAQGKDISLVAPESTVDFGNADGNIVVTKEGNNLKFDLAKDLTGDSLTINNGGPVLSKTGLNLNHTKITNLQAGSEDTDGVNVKQLKDLKAEGLNF
ncbi:MAG: hypothetical protein KA346_08005, partial [Neisseriaceae bacterium]|nr:hypothetical protein [Neisseriaceae bacterium]